MAEAQEKRTEETGSDSNTKQDNSKNDLNKQNTSSGNQVVSKVENALGVEAGTTKDIYKQAKDTAGQAFEKVSEKATTQIGEQKDNLAKGLSSVADNIRQMGENLRGGEEETPIANITAKYGDSLAKQVEQVSTYLEQKDLRDVLKDVEGFARRNPAVFIGGAFALGILAARFLKSSGGGSSKTRSLKKSSQFKRDGLHMPDGLDEQQGLHLPEDLEEQLESKDSKPLKFGTSDTGKTTSTGSTSGEF